MAEEEEDIISTLPDAILCHILSFLQTKESVATSILSKRWNPLWRSVTVLHFKPVDEDPNSVYSVLLSRDAALPINTFHLEAPGDSLLWEPIGIDGIPEWIDFVVQRKLEYLSLCVTHDLANLPITLLTCKTIVVLKLHYFDVDLPISSVLLPSLKTLHLDSIWFRTVRDFMLFLTGCPILEDLFTSYVCFNHAKESLTCNEWKSFYLSNLARADIDYSDRYFPLKAIQDVPSLRLEISQENYYYYKEDGLIPDFHIPTFHNLTHLELICRDDSWDWEFLIDVLNHCPKLQRLDLLGAGYNMKTLAKLPDVVPQCLSLHLRTCNLFRFRGLHGELMLAKYILKNAEVLKTMKIRNHGQPEIEKILSSFPRASSKCELTVNDVPCK